MKKILLIIITAFPLLFLPLLHTAQSPNLGTAANFGLFTITGALENTGTTFITGNVGTNAGAYNGFGPATVTGQVHLGDTTAAQAAMDVDALYVYLQGMTCTAVAGTTLGNNQVLTPNVYCTGAATTLNGNLYLDAQGDRNALFIFQVDGAFATGTFANVILLNKASMCNVYWQVNGAFALGDHSIFRGTIVVNGAISLLDGSSMAGRAFSKVGAISLFDNDIVAIVSQPEAAITSVAINGVEETLTAVVTNAIGPFSYLWSPGGDTTSSIVVSSMLTEIYTVTVTAMNGCSDALATYELEGEPLPVGLISFKGRCAGQQVELNWITASETNNHFYSIERGTNGISWQVIGTVSSAGNSNALRNYSFTDPTPGQEIFYRLKQTDIDGRYKYFNAITVRDCNRGLIETSVYPNPGRGIFNITTTGDKITINSMAVYNLLNERIYQVDGYQPFIDLSDRPAGIYFLHINSHTGRTVKKLVISK